MQVRPLNKILGETKITFVDYRFRVCFFRNTASDFDNIKQYTKLIYKADQQQIISSMIDLLVQGILSLQSSSVSSAWPFSERVELNFC